MTGLGNKELVAGMIDKVNMLVDGGELIQVSIACKLISILGSN